MNKIAIIDCGTNTFHLLIGLINEGLMEIAHNEKIMVQIGKGGISEKTIAPEAIERAWNALSKYKGIIDQHGVEHVHVFATSAFRNADNGADVAEQFERQLGFRINIIDGLQEAQLIYEGIKRALPLFEKPSLVVDIGGGSIEFIIADNTGIKWSKSYEIGAQRLVDKFHTADPIPTTSLDQLYAFLETAPPELEEQMHRNGVRELIGSSGTFDTLSAMYFAAQKQDVPNDPELPLPLAFFHDIYQQLIQGTRIDRLKIPGMLPMRVDMIVVASSVIHYLIKHFSITNIRVSTYAMKEGILYRILNSDNT